MTSVGFWREEATVALREARAALHERRLLPGTDIHAVAVFRSTVYAQLARVTTLLVGRSPVREVPTREAATELMRQPASDTTRLFAGLRGAAQLGAEYLLPSVELGEVPQRLRRAADAIAVIGDILASHVTPAGRPRTQEGHQIRAHGGVTAALAGVAQLTTEAIAVDGQLPAWLDGDGSRTEMRFHPLAHSADWVTNGPLLAVADAVLLAAAPGRPPLLDALELSRQPSVQPPPVSTADGAVTAINAARNWLWQHPEQLTATHLQLAAKLGLKLHELVDQTETPTRTPWRTTALAVAELRGPPAVDVAAHAAEELDEVLHWLRTPQSDADRVPPHDLERLARPLAGLAGTLHRGLDRAMQAGNLFVSNAVLRRQQGSLIYRATQRWRPATRADDPVRDLSRALWLLAKPATTPAASHVPAAGDRETHPGLSGPPLAGVGGPNPADLARLNFAAEPEAVPEVALAPLRAEAEAEVEAEVRRDRQPRHR